MGRRFDALTFGPARRTRRMRKRLEALDRSDAKLRAAGLDPLDEWHRSQDPRIDPRPAAPPGRGRSPRLAHVAVAVVLVPAAVYVAVHQLRTDPRGTGFVASATGRPSNFPPASREEGKHSLGAPAAAPAGVGGYRFEDTQPGTAAPVTWDPCRPIHYVVNGAAPAGQEGVIPSAVTELSRLTGLMFVYDGPTAEPATASQRSPYQPSRYGHRWAPVLVSWTDPTRVPRLAGNVIGLGGGVAVGLNGSPRSYVSGIVYLDAPQFRRGTAGAGSKLQQRATLRAVVLHEFGHLLGLDHVSDPAAIMYPEAGLRVTDYSPGDLRGLHALATGRCNPNL